MTTPQQPWTRFFFESNMFFGFINGPEDWKHIRKAYPEYDDAKLLSAKEATCRGRRDDKERAEHPNYGFRWEHDGEKTLRDFFVEHGMPIPYEMSNNDRDKVAEALANEAMLEIDKEVVRRQRIE